MTITLKMMTYFFLGLMYLQPPACTTKSSAKAIVTEITKPMKLKITIGASSFEGTLTHNETAAAFAKRLPLTLTMSELNNNEKYNDLNAALPTNASNPGMIQNGDLMLYGANTLVLFYKTFSTSYSYTKIAKINNPEKLATALGRGVASVKFELE